MVDTARSAFITFLLIALFAFSLIAFGVQVSLDNNTNSTILKNDVINRTFAQLETNLSQQEGIAGDQRESFEGENPILGTDSFLFKSIIGAGKTFTSSLSIFNNLFFGFILKTLGLGEGKGLVILGTFSAIILIIIIFVLWRSYKTGV